MSDDKYNGWTNRETWLVGLWGYIDDVLVPCARESGMPSVDGEWCRSVFEDTIDLGSVWLDEYGNGGIISDMLGGALSRIDWYEISKHVNDGIVQ